MGAIGDNPVLMREVRGRLRLRKLSGRAWKAAGVVLVLIIVRYYSMGLAAVHRGRVDDAAELWRDLTMIALGLIVLFAPLMAATAISQEREQQTWDLLAVTRLSGAQVILGKWLARQTIPFVVILVACPIVAACGIRGQTGAVGIFANLGYLVLNCAFFGALGLWCSSTVKRTPAATAAALMMVAAICVGTPIVDAIIDPLVSWTARQHGLDTYTCWINPFYALYIMDGLIIDPTRPNPHVRFHVITTSVLTEVFMTAIFLLSLLRRYGRQSGV